MEVVIAVVVIALVGYYVARPLRAVRGERLDPRIEDPLGADLEARKQAKYREIRDTELDHAQGKLDDVEFKRQEAELKREAIEILRAIDSYEADKVERKNDAPEPLD